LRQHLQASRTPNLLLFTTFRFMKNTAKLRNSWLLFAISGLILVGLGLSIVGEAIILKSTQQAYFVVGTLGLIAFNAGLSIFGQAVIFRYRYLKAKGREASERKSGRAPHRNRGRGRGPKRPNSGSGSGSEGGQRSSGFKSRFEE
jgi:hypothetical protein